MDSMNNNTVLREEQGGGSSWVWWLIGLIVVAGVLWLLFGGNTTNPDMNNGDTGVITDETNLPDDVEYDENGLPILGPDAPINSAMVETSEGFPVQATLVVTGDLPNGCTYLNSPSQVRQGNTFYVNLSTRTEGEVCTEALVPYERRIALNVTNLPAGAYVVNLNGQQISFELAQDNAIDFEAGLEK